MSDIPSQDNAIKSLLVPMQQTTILLPMACLAEVIDYFRPFDLEDTNNWHLGSVDWRGTQIPLVSFERFNNTEFSPVASTALIAVINKTTATGKYRFYGVVIQGIPQPFRLTRNDVLICDDVPGPAEMTRMVVKEISVMVPDLEALERELSELSHGADHAP
ncbi:chemotaxis protein CheW [Candidatus Sororendozoicomonas aggregata]|uniref:chemotaxis protein CheW n=1 Tax=Candidatus Sororendozoicomonas aggregata TaxID=3073239 RepID=UPI002ED63B77